MRYVLKLSIVCVSFFVPIAVIAQTQPVSPARLEKSQIVQSEKSEEVVDEIVAIVFLDDASAMVARSDMRPRLDGIPRDLHQAILDRLMELDARAAGVQVGEEDIDRFLEVIQKEFGLDSAHINELFAQFGYSPQEGREQVRLRQMIDQAIEHRVRNRGSLIIQRSDVEAYYKAHPENVPAVYELAQAVAPAQDWTEELLRKAAQDDSLHDVSWEESFSIKEEEVALDKKDFLAKASAGEVFSIEKNGDFFELTKLINRTDARLRTLDERYDEIALVLQHERFDAELKKYERALFERAQIHYTYEQDRITLD